LDTADCRVPLVPGNWRGTLQRPCTYYMRGPQPRVGAL
jgi:hypothetical protein